MEWQDYQDEFIARGGLMQIIIHDVSQQDWEKLLNFLQKTEVRLRFTIDGEMAELPAQIEDVFHDDIHHYLLSLMFDDVSLNCDLEKESTMAFQFDPGQITDATKATLLFRVMSTFARRLRKVAVMTDVSEEPSAIFSYSHGQGLIYLKLARKFSLYE